MTSCLLMALWHTLALPLCANVRVVTHAQPDGYTLLTSF